MSVTKDEFAGRLIVTLPKAMGQELGGWQIGALNAETGLEIPTILDLTIHVNPSEAVTAEATMLADADAKPLIEAGAVVQYDEDGAFRTGSFKWLIAGLRVAE